VVFDGAVGGNLTPEDSLTKLRALCVSSDSHLA
jgi:hypothetical protein